MHDCYGKSLSCNASIISLHACMYVCVCVRAYNIMYMLLRPSSRSEYVGRENGPSTFYTVAPIIVLYCSRNSISVPPSIIIIIMVSFFVFVFSLQVFWFSWGHLQWCNTRWNRQCPTEAVCSHTTALRWAGEWSGLHTLCQHQCCQCSDWTQEEAFFLHHQQAEPVCVLWL